jgi:hypothetical protein
MATMGTSQRARRGILGGLLLLGWLAAPGSLAAQAEGCRTELGKTGAKVAAQLLVADSSGALVPAGEPATEIEARSGQGVRLLIRPLEGSARPSGAECPVRVDVEALTDVARLLGRDGFFFDSGRAYALLRPAEERSLDFRIEPFEEWDSATDKIELGDVTIRLPETAEFVARLPAPVRPTPGTVCADVVYPDAESAAGVALGLAAPPDGPSDRRAVGPDGRVCWEGFDEFLYGDLSLEESAESALGMPDRRYVSRDASYRLFVVKRLD